MSNTAAVTETVRSTSSSTYATDPLGVFLVTGNNSTTGPPISSDADYASLCLSLPAATTQFDSVHRLIGRPGVVLIGEGAPHRVRPLIAQEKKKIARVAGDRLSV